MKKILLVAALLIVCGPVAAQAMGDLYVSGTWRYKMTVVVETPEGIKTGSAVREVSNSASSVKLIDLPQAGNPAKVKGEAVVVDLGERGKLFAPLKGYKWGEDYADSILYDVFPSSVGDTTAAGIRFYKNLKNAKATLTPSDYPMFVTFKDLSDPKTVTSVLEMERDTSQGNYPMRFKITKDRFEEFFGAGVKLKEITIEMADEPVTWGVEKLLPWLPEYYNKRLDGQRFGTINTDNRFANRFSAGAFSTGEKNDN